MSVDGPTPTKAKPDEPVGGGIGLGLVLVVLSVAIVLVADSGTLDFWPTSLQMGLLSTFVGLLVVMPAYLVVAGVTTLILKATHCSPRVRRRWLLGPPLILLAAVVLHQLNRLRPSVSFEAIVELKAPPSLRQFHSSRLTALMQQREVAWFEIAPADLTNLISSRQLVATNEPSLSHLLTSDPWLRQAKLTDRLPVAQFSHVYLHRWSELNFRTERFLFTTPAHDRAVWVYRHDR